MNFCNFLVVFHQIYIVYGVSPSSSGKYDRRLGSSSPASVPSTSSGTQNLPALQRSYAQAVIIGPSSPEVMSASRAAKKNKQRRERLKEEKKKNPKKASWEVSSSETGSEEEEQSDKPIPFVEENDERLREEEKEGALRNDTSPPLSVLETTSSNVSSKSPSSKSEDHAQISMTKETEMKISEIDYSKKGVKGKAAAKVPVRRLTKSEKKKLRQKKGKIEELPPPELALDAERSANETISRSHSPTALQGKGGVFAEEKWDTNQTYDSSEKIIVNNVAEDPPSQGPESSDKPTASDADKQSFMSLLKNAGIPIPSEQRKEVKPYPLNIVFGTFSPMSLPTTENQSSTHENDILRSVSPENEIHSERDEKNKKSEKVSTTSPLNSAIHTDEQSIENIFPPKIRIYRSWASEAEAEEDNEDSNDDKSFTDEAPVTVFPSQSLLQTEEKLPEKSTTQGTDSHLTRNSPRNILLIVSKTVGVDSITELEKTTINPDNFGATEIVRLRNSGLIVKCDSEEGAVALKEVISNELKELDVQLTDFSSNIVCLHNLPQEVSVDEIQRAMFQKYNENPLKIQFIHYEVRDRQDIKIALLDVSDSFMDSIEPYARVELRGDSHEIFLLIPAEATDEQILEESSSPKIIQDFDEGKNDQHFIEKSSSESMRDEKEDEENEGDGDDDKSFTKRAQDTLSPEERTIIDISEYPHSTTEALTPHTVENSIVLIFPKTQDADTVVELDESNINLDNFGAIDSVRLVDCGVIVKCDSEAGAVRLQNVITSSIKELNAELISFSSNVFCIYDVPQEVTDNEISLSIFETYEENPLKVKFLPYEISIKQREKIVLLELSDSLLKRLDPPPIIQIRGVKYEMYVVFMSDQEEEQSIQQNLSPKIIDRGSSDEDRKNQDFVEANPEDSVAEKEVQSSSRTSPSESVRQEETQMIKQARSPKETKKEDKLSLSTGSRADSAILAEEQLVERTSFPKTIRTVDEEKRKERYQDINEANEATSVTMSPTKSVEQPLSPKKNISRRERAAAKHKKRRESLKARKKAKKKSWEVASPESEAETENQIASVDLSSERAGDEQRETTSQISEKDSLRNLKARKTSAISKNSLLIVSGSPGIRASTELEKSSLSPNDFGVTSIVQLIDSGLIVKCDTEEDVYNLEEAISIELEGLLIELTYFSSHVACINDVPQETTGKEISQILNEKYKQIPISIDFISYEVRLKQHLKVVLLDVDDSLLNKIKTSPIVQMQNSQFRIEVCLQVGQKKAAQFDHEDIPKPSSPQDVEVVIDDLPGDITVDDVTQIVLKKFEESPVRVEILPSKEKQNTSIAKLEVNQSLLEKMAISPKVQIGWGERKIHTPVNTLYRCLTCQLLGHQAKFCRGQKRPPPLLHEMCVDCCQYNYRNKLTGSNQRDTNHKTDDEACPTKIAHVLRCLRLKGLDNVSPPDGPNNSDKLKKKFSTRLLGRPMEYPRHFQQHGLNPVNSATPMPALLELPSETQHLRIPKESLLHFHQRFPVTSPTGLPVLPVHTSETQDHKTPMILPQQRVTNVSKESNSNKLSHPEDIWPALPVQQSKPKYLRPLLGPPESFQKPDSAIATPAVSTFQTSSPSNICPPLSAQSNQMERSHQRLQQQDSIVSTPAPNIVVETINSKESHPAANIDPTVSSKNYYSQNQTELSHHHLQPVSVVSTPAANVVREARLKQLLPAADIRPAVSTQQHQKQLLPAQRREPVASTPSINIAKISNLDQLSSPGNVQPVSTNLRLSESQPPKVLPKPDSKIGDESNYKRSTLIGNTFPESSNFALDERIMEKIGQSVEQYLAKGFPLLNKTILDAVDQSVQQTLSKMLPTASTSSSNKLDRSDQRKGEDLISEEEEAEEEEEEEEGEEEERGVGVEEDNVYKNVPHRRQASGPRENKGSNAILIRAKHSGIDVAKELGKMNIDPRPAFITRAIFYPSGDVLLMCNTVEGANFLRNVGIKSSELEIFAWRGFPNKVRIDPVPYDCAPIEINDSIREKFKEVPKRVEFRPYRGTRNAPMKIALVSASESLLKKMQDSPSILIRGRPLKIDTSVRPPRCAKCQLFGHRAEICRSTYRPPARPYEKCLDCCYYNRRLRDTGLRFVPRDENHATDSISCPAKMPFTSNTT